MRSHLLHRKKQLFHQEILKLGVYLVLQHHQVMYSGQMTVDQRRQCFGYTTRYEWNNNKHFLTLKHLYHSYQFMYTNMHVNCKGLSLSLQYGL